MKKRLIITLLMIMIYMILGSCNSCTSSSAQSSIADSSCVQQDTLYRTTTYGDTIDVVLSSDSSVDNQKTKAIFRKEIKPMVIDTLQRIRRDSTFKKLQKTEIEMKQQQKRIDSILIVRKK